MDAEFDSASSEISEVVTSPYDENPIEYDTKSLDTYLASLPYQSETIPEMHAKLQYVMELFVTSVKSREWKAVNNYNDMILCWLLLRYPLPTNTRAHLVKLYYELILIPGMDPRSVRSWVDSLVKLIANKGPGSKRKLQPSDLQLEWYPLWYALQKELFPKKRGADSSRNMVNILLYAAEQCKTYYPTNEIEPMLSAFLPLLTRDLADERMLEIMGNLAIEHVGNRSYPDTTPWLDVGIFSEDQWNVLMGKCLGSFNIPVGATKGASTTGTHADGQADSQSLQIKKNGNRYNYLAQILVYSMSVDHLSRSGKEDTYSLSIQPTETRWLAGSRALDSLQQLMTSTETYFHPSNAEYALNSPRGGKKKNNFLVERLKLTPIIKYNFVSILRTPALLAMFSKDPISMSFAQGALRIMAILEPSLIMPEILERAYGGLETINETHRTTAVLSTLSGVALPLVSDILWLGGQKHILPLLELCLPGIDLNDPSKTVCTTMFLVAVLQNIKIVDLTSVDRDCTFVTDDGMNDVFMSGIPDGLPDGVDQSSSRVLNKSEERALVRESTAGFTDWIANFFRRVFALYENLPEEGGKRNTTGGKVEESVIKSLKSALDVICLHLSDTLFDFVLNLTFNYATSNAKANAVRAFGGLVGCLARVKPDKTLEKFLPYCIGQIVTELRHGASSVRTTSTHGAVPADTTLHWCISILRGCMGYGGLALLHRKHEIINLLSLLVDKTLSERGFTSTGRLLTRILSTLTSVYPINSRFVNTNEWDDPAFDHDNLDYWGKLYEAKDVKVDWHTPCQEEIDFALEILDIIVEPLLTKVELLLGKPKSGWDGVWRNDFCRFVHAIRSTWSGLSTIILEKEKEVITCFTEDSELPEFLPIPLKVAAGFALTYPDDPLYQKFLNHKQRFGQLLHRAAVAFRESDVDDHIDATLAVSRAIDVYLLEYGITASAFSALSKSYIVIRECPSLQRLWSKSKQFSRLVLLKRAQVYHCTRIYLNAMFRQRDSLDDDLILDLVELSLSPYTRIRRHSQAILMTVMQHYVCSTRFCLPHLLRALAKDTDPDRMKGALFLLSSKGTASYTVGDRRYAGDYILSLLRCQHQEKPSIQKLVLMTLVEVLNNMSPETLSSHIYTMDMLGVDASLAVVQADFEIPDSRLTLLNKAMSTLTARLKRKEEVYFTIVNGILDIANDPSTHWRYVQASARLLSHMLRRDVVPSGPIAQFFIRNVLSDHPSLRATSIRAIVKILRTIKIQTWSRSNEELWLDSWHNPLSLSVNVNDPDIFMQILSQPLSEDKNTFYVDKLNTGFLVWARDVKAYSFPPETDSPFQWNDASLPALKEIQENLDDQKWFMRLVTLWSQESSTAANGTTDMYEGRYLDTVLNIIEPLWQDTDRFNQRASAEILQGMMRGSKHWPQMTSERLWMWITPRLPRILTSITPDTMQIWESTFSMQLRSWDPRRNQPLINFIISLPLDFSGESPFFMSKSLNLVGIMAECLGARFEPYARRYVDLFFDNANTGYAEIRSHIASNLDAIMKIQWHPGYQSISDLLHAVETTQDPLLIREAKHRDRIQTYVKLFPEWKQLRLPPPNQAQSEVRDIVGLTLLQFIWTGAHGSFAPAIFPYSAPLLPSFLEMAELNDSSDLQLYSTAVLYVLSAVMPPQEYVQGVADMFMDAIVSSTSWRVRLNALPTLAVFWYRNLTSFTSESMSKLMNVLLQCLEDENLEVREMAAKTLSSVLRSSQRQRILPLKETFTHAIRQNARLPNRQVHNYAECMRKLHGGILGVVALVDAYPYTVPDWMPSLCEVLAPHATDPPPIAQTIRRCASDFKKTHQDMWHIDQHQFNEEQLQALSTMLSGNSYYA
ncbi:hypothetical protein Clacol_003687 [Clathrus columnatus]|uniref:Proteasome activator complex subunit 4 n=1 Tax=Clathrus columnatus TaxID=1419009 RepID=A0AAV5A4A6_9AGAM|nr:hypothetical protein Clacol_003687 [Clathrus columnatus]